MPEIVEEKEIDDFLNKGNVESDDDKAEAQSGAEQAKPTESDSEDDNQLSINPPTD